MYDYATMYDQTKLYSSDDLKTFLALSLNCTGFIAQPYKLATRIHFKILLILVGRTWFYGYPKSRFTVKMTTKSDRNTAQIHTITRTTQNYMYM